jgi:serine phosphatase RsbU (regulator of sigma subunit)/anti-sigma regulatory factor (Ser/Thr protein kinase)
MTDGQGPAGEPPARAVERAGALQRVTEATLAYLDLDDLLAELMRRTTEILDADTSAILLVEENGRMLAVRAARGLEEAVERGFRLPVGDGFAGRVAATRTPVVIEDLEQSEIQVRNPEFRTRGVRSLLGVPLVVEGRLVGVLHVGTLERRTFDDDAIHLLQTVGDRAALAIENARLIGQDRIARAVQRTLLPRRLPRIPGIDLAARYLPAAEGSVGGDWYDVISLEDGRLGLAIGDVAGHGLDAAVTMWELRNVLRAYAIEALEAAEVVSQLDRYVDAQHRDTMATVAYATIELERSTMTIARAGHPFPLSVDRDGSASYVGEGSAGPPLGWGRAPTRTQEEVPFEAGTTLVLYTDGLIERRGRRLTEGEALLAAVVSDGPVDPELMCANIIHRLTGDAKVDDDLAMLVVRNTGLGDRFEIVIAAAPEELSTVRRALARWLSNGVASRAEIDAIALACSEACANAVEHAYGPGDANLEVRAERDRDSVEVTVRDGGTWRPPRGSGGRGIGIMRAFMDDVSIAPTDEGTTVRLTKRFGSEE